MLCIGEGCLSIPHTRKVFEDTPFREKKFLHFYSQLLYNPPVASSRRRELKPAALCFPLRRRRVASSRRRELKPHPPKRRPAHARRLLTEA